MPSRVYCCYKGCKNHNRMKRFHFYRFPRDETRCEAWVKAAQNKKLLGLPASRLNAFAVLCNEHFQDWCFMNIESKTSLVHNAIPASPKPVSPPKDSTLLHQIKKEVEDRVEETQPIIPKVKEREESPAVYTRTISKDHHPMVDSPESQPGKKQTLPFFPIIHTVASISNESRSVDDKELELYLKLLAQKLKSYSGFERHLIMNEIGGIFLRRPPSSGGS